MSFAVVAVKWLWTFFSNSGVLTRILGLEKTIYVFIRSDSFSLLFQTIRSEILRDSVDYTLNKEPALHMHLTITVSLNFLLLLDHFFLFILLIRVL